jgi:quinol monooxygenase YgiN
VAAVLVVTRYVVPGDEQSAFLDQCRGALAALAARPGCRSGHVARSIDDPTLWTLTTTWESVGAYRRALSSYEVKLYAVPLMYRAVDEPTAFEDLVVWTPDGGTVEHESRRSADADVVNLGEAGVGRAPRDLG